MHFQHIYRPTLDLFWINLYFTLPVSAPVNVNAYGNYNVINVSTNEQGERLTKIHSTKLCFNSSSEVGLVELMGLQTVALSLKYRQTSNIKRFSVGNIIIDHSYVVGASPVGAAPTTSPVSTYHLAPKDWAKTTARRDEKYLCFGICSDLYLGLTVSHCYSFHDKASA